MVDRAAYRECKCEVKVGDMMSESFNVMKGLRQGCVLSLSGGEAQGSRGWDRM